MYTDCYEIQAVLRIVIILKSDAAAVACMFIVFCHSTMLRSVFICVGADLRVCPFEAICMVINWGKGEHAGSPLQGSCFCVGRIIPEASSSVDPFHYLFDRRRFDFASFVCVESRLEFSRPSGIDLGFARIVETLKESLDHFSPFDRRKLESICYYFFGCCCHDISRYAAASDHGLIFASVSASSSSATSVSWTTCARSQ